MRRLEFIFFILLHVSVAEAQPTNLQVEAGISFGEPCHQCGYGAATTADNVWGIQVGATSRVNDTFNLAWGIRYNLISCTDTLLGFLDQNAPLFVSTTQLKQHYVSFPLLLQIPTKYVYLVFGPNLGFLASASRFNEWEEYSTVETTKRNSSSEFTRLNLMFSAGTGIAFRVFSQQIYIQLLYSRSALNGYQSVKAFNSGFDKELYLGAGIKL